MPKFPKPFYRSARNCWFVQLGKEQIKLHADETEAIQNVRNSMVRTHCFCAAWRSCHRPGGSNSINAHHALRFQARAVITMYAPLLVNASTGAQRPHPAFQLRDQVLLVAAVVARPAARTFTA